MLASIFKLIVTHAAWLGFWEGEAEDSFVDRSFLRRLGIKCTSGYGIDNMCCEDNGDDLTECYSCPGIDCATQSGSCGTCTDDSFSCTGLSSGETVSI